MSKHLTNRVCVGEWARISTRSGQVFEGRIHTVERHRLSIYNDPAATSFPVSKVAGERFLRRVDIDSIQVSLGR